MLHLRLDGDGPLHRQTYRALRDAILAGRLRPGERLTSSRDLAAELGVSRNTVLQAYDRLVAEGYATTRPASGTYVADALPARPAGASSSTGARGVTSGARASTGGARSTAGGARGAAARQRDAHPPTMSAFARRFTEAVPTNRATWSLPREPLPYDFRYGEPSYADLPLATWARLLGRRARRLSVRRLAYQPPGGAEELRRALAGYLSRARAVVCAPEQVLIVRGSQQAIDLTMRLLVDPGDTVVLEEPHYTGFSFCAAAAGARLVHVPVDEQGLRTSELGRIRAARLACVTPSHQFPAGGVLALPRRLELLDWARTRSAYVLEDDYDGEFRFAGQPLECLQALDRDGRVLYSGTASKILFPALRIGWLVVPEELLDVFRAALALADTGTATLEQLAFADLIAEGHLERHVRRIRLRHATRRAALLDAVARELGSRAELLGESAGLHVLLRLRELGRRDVTRLRAACRERGVGVYPAAHFYAEPPPYAELLLGYGSLSERAIREGIRRLAQALDALGR
ncbi:MAG TPA: PLP-dependent aminotransferase family protein [Candidatus Binatia bacterium]